MNQEIRAREVRVIDPDGQQLGVMSPGEALRVAVERGLDLIEIAAQATPPVCKIMDYGKYRYEQSKREKAARQRSKHTEVKGIQIRPNTGEHDVQTKVKRARKFLEEGHKVKFDMIFRGPEMRHVDIGRDLLVRVAELCGELAEVERRPLMQGRRMHMILTPSKHPAKAESPSQPEATPAPSPTQSEQ
jgi:translation initiation factor IF-3